MSKKPWLILFGVVFLASAMLACDGGEGDEDGKGANGGGDGGSGGDDGGGFPEGVCNADHPCPKGQFCFNGLCAIGCQSDEQCADGQYCDLADGPTGWCKNREVPTCSKDADCAASQECRGGLCLEKPVEPPAECEWKGNSKEAIDGCAEDEICIPEDLERLDGRSRCYKAPPCSQDFTCPVGTHGATCNVAPDGGSRLIASKGAICMPSLCREAADCPTSGFPKFVCRDVGAIGFCEPQISAPGGCEADWECDDLTPVCCEVPGLGTKVCMNGCL